MDLWSFGDLFWSITSESTATFYNLIVANAVCTSKMVRNWGCWETSWAGRIDILVCYCNYYWAQSRAFSVRNLFYFVLFYFFDTNRVTSLLQVGPLFFILLLPFIFVSWDKSLLGVSITIHFCGLCPSMNTLSVARWAAALHMTCPPFILILLRITATGHHDSPRIVFVVWFDNWFDE